jgi:predicted SAM-dependent methyltransferase
MSVKIALSLGSGCRFWGRESYGYKWYYGDIGNYDFVDFKDITNLKQFNDNSVDLIYNSHVFPYFDRQEGKKVLEEWYRVLKPNGIMRIAVSDFKTMARLYVYDKLPLEKILGPLFGKMNSDWYDKDSGIMIYEKTTYDFDSLRNVLREVGFKNIHKYNWQDYDIHRENDDHSQCYVLPDRDKENGLLISLNVECEK